MVFAEIGSSLLLFCLVFGMSATVDVHSMRKQLNNRAALLIGISLQFIILPFVGFLVVKAFSLPAVTGITLLAVTSSPGGSYSNWWCSMFNAELALSVTMTGISTLLSIIMLPVNLMLYTRWTYSSDVVKSLDWSALFMSLVVVIGGIVGGLILSARAAKTGNTYIFHQRANRLGNIAGLFLITLSVTVSSTDHETSLWNQDLPFYIGVALPAFVGLGLASWLATKFDLEKPERVAVAVEACYQNTGIATSVAITMFSGTPDLGNAIGVPLYYGLVEALMLAVFCMICWKAGWTKAPIDENLCVVLLNSYEVDETDRREQESAIEVVLGSGDHAKAPNDLVFEQIAYGAYKIDDVSLRHGEQESTRINNQSYFLNGDANRCNDATMGPKDAKHQTNGPVILTRIGYFGSVQIPPSSPTATVSTECIDEDAMVESNPQQTTNRLGKAASSIRARATGYRQTKQAPPETIPTAWSDCDEAGSAPPKSRPYQAIANESPEKERRLANVQLSGNVPARDKTIS
jgi:predicted Na+-dependent transporter